MDKIISWDSDETRFRNWLIDHQSLVPIAAACGPLVSRCKMSLDFSPSTKGKSWVCLPWMYMFFRGWFKGKPGGNQPVLGIHKRHTTKTSGSRNPMLPRRGQHQNSRKTSRWAPGREGRSPQQLAVLAAPEQPVENLGTRPQV